MLTLLLIGILLGAISVLPIILPLVSRFTGISAAGSSVTYLLVAFAVAWVYQGTWKKSFVSSVFVIVLALASFYFFVSMPFLRFDISFRTNFPIMPALTSLTSTLTDLAIWAMIAIPACALTTTIAYAIRRANTKIWLYAIIALSYVGFLYVLYLEHARRIISSAGMIAHDDTLSITPQFMGRIFEIIVIFIFITVFFSIVLKQRLTALHK